MSKLTEPDVNAMTDREIMVHLLRIPAHADQ